MQCSNNLKQLGLAMHNYHDANGVLPPGRPYSRSTSAQTTGVTIFTVHPIAPATGPYSDTYCGGWMVRALPYVEQGNQSAPLASAMRSTIGTVFTAMGTRKLSLVGCPSDPNFGGSGSGSTSIGTQTAAFSGYVGITGNNETAPTGNFNGTNGLFATTGKGVKIEAISDGTSNTIAVAERPAAKDGGWGWRAYSDFDTTLGYPNRTSVDATCRPRLPGPGSPPR